MKGGRMKKLICLFLGVTLLLTGCTGSFHLTRNVWQFHRGMEGEWTDELVFLGCVILPVYGLASLGDAIIFNSIEFWTGENPITVKADTEKRIVKSSDKTATITHQEDGTIRVQSEDKEFVFERASEGVIAKDVNGEILYTSSKNENDEISIFDSNGKLVRKFNPQDSKMFGM